MNKNKLTSESSKYCNWISVKAFNGSSSLSVINSAITALVFKQVNQNSGIPLTGSADGFSSFFTSGFSSAS